MDDVFARGAGCIAYNANECSCVSYELETYTKQFRLNFVPLTNTLNLMKSIASAILYSDHIVVAYISRSHGCRLYILVQVLSSAGSSSGSSSGSSGPGCIVLVFVEHNIKYKVVYCDIYRDDVEYKI